MAYDPRAVANYFLSLAESQGQSMTPMKIQKLVYFAQGWHLAIRDESPLIDEQVEAWKFGPVIPSLYRSFREYGDQPIMEPATYLVTEGSSRSVEEIEFRQVIPSINDLPDKAVETKNFLERIWAVYGNYSAIQLSNMTHQAGTPWDEINKKYGGTIPKGTDIPRESMTAYFRGLARLAKRA